MAALWLRRWLMAAVMVPIAGRVALRMAGRMERRRGVTPMSRRLREGGTYLRGRRGGRRGWRRR